MKPVVTVERLRALYHYDPATGIFTARTARNRWPAGRVATRAKGDGYLIIQIGQHSYTAHRMAWLYVTGSLPRNVVDHINGDPSDNRFSNLRDVSHAVNMQNRHRPAGNTATGLLGVTPRSDNPKKWSARISVDSRLVHLGTFETPEAAHAAYLAAKARFHQLPQSEALGETA